MRPRWRSRGDGLDGMHPQDRSVSEGRRQPSLLAREEWPPAVRGRRSAEPLQARAGPVPDQPKREAVWGAFAPPAENDVNDRCLLTNMISQPPLGPSSLPSTRLPCPWCIRRAAPDKALLPCRARYQMKRIRPYRWGTPLWGAPVPNALVFPSPRATMQSGHPEP